MPRWLTWATSNCHNQPHVIYSMIPRYYLPIYYLDMQQVHHSIIICMKHIAWSISSLWWRARYDGEHVLWWRACYDGEHAMVESMLWWRACYGGEHAMMESTCYDGEHMLWWRAWWRRAWWRRARSMIESMEHDWEHGAWLRAWSMMESGEWRVESMESMESMEHGAWSVLLEYLLSMEHGAYYRIMKLVNICWVIQKHAS